MNTARLLCKLVLAAALLVGAETSLKAEIYAPDPAMTISGSIFVAETGQRTLFNANPNGGTPATSGDTNLALFSNGGLAFESSRIAAPYGDDKINNGVYGLSIPDNDDATRPWISGAADNNGFAGVQFASASTLSSFGFGSRFPERSNGLFTLEYTTSSFGGVDLEVPGQVGALSWLSLGTINSTTSDEFGRHLFGLTTPVANVTGIRVVASQGGSTITEIEAYSSPLPLPDATAPATPYSMAILNDNPIHYYRFEESHTGQLVKDEMGGASNGAFHGNVTTSQASVHSNLGNAFSFDGSSGTHITLSKFHPGNTVSVEAWAKLDGDAANTFLPIAARLDGSYELDIDGNGGGDLANFVVLNDANTVAIPTSATPFTRDTWHHVVGIFENGVATVYIDGVAGASVDISGTGMNLQDLGDFLLLGSTRDGTQFNWDGLLDEIAFYDYGLSQSQINDHIAAAIPEPSAFLLLALAGIPFLRRRRSQR